MDKKYIKSIISRSTDPNRIQMNHSQTLVKNSCIVHKTNKFCYVLFLFCKKGKLEVMADNCFAKLFRGTNYYEEQMYRLILDLVLKSAVLFTLLRQQIKKAGSVLNCDQGCTQNMENKLFTVLGKEITIIIISGTTLKNTEIRWMDRFYI